MPYFNRWGNFQFVQLQPVAGDCIKGSVRPTAWRFPLTLEFKPLWSVFLHVCVMFYFVHYEVSRTRIQGISNAETDFHAQGKEGAGRDYASRYLQLHTETCSQYPMVYDNSIPLYLNKIQVRYSQSAVSTNKGLWKQDA